MGWSEEDVLLRHKGRRRMRSVSLPGGAGQFVKAFVVLRSGLGGYETMVTELQDIVKAVAQYTYPRAVVPARRCRGQ